MTQPHEVKADSKLLFQALTTSFSKSYLRRQRREELALCKMTEHETVTEYESRLGTLARRVPNLTDQDMLDYWIMGVTKPIKAHLILFNPQTYEEAIQLARQKEESLIIEKAEDKTPQKGKYCRYCRRQGHSIDECRTKQRLYGNTSTTQVSNTKTTTTQTSTYPSTTTSSVGFNRSTTGNVPPASRTFKCAYCLKIGHTEDRCFQKEKQQPKGPNRGPPHSKPENI